MKDNLKNKIKFDPKILFFITFLLFYFLHSYLDFSFNDIGPTIALFKFILYLVFGVFFLYLFICYTFVYIRMKIRESNNRKKAAIHEEEKRIKDEKYREWYKDHYDDY